MPLGGGIHRISSPFVYLKATLQALASGYPTNQIDGLMPWPSIKRQAEIWTRCAHRTLFTHDGAHLHITSREQSCARKWRCMIFPRRADLGFPGYALLFFFVLALGNLEQAVGVQYLFLWLVLVVIA